MTIPNALSKKPGQASKSAARTAVGRRDQRGAKSSNDGCSKCCGMLIGLVLAGFACAAMALYSQYSLNLNLHSYHDGDQVLASEAADDLNSVLCEAYTVTASERVNMYLTDGPAKVSTKKMKAVLISNSGLRADDKYDYRAFYLLPGSEIMMDACMSVFNRNPRIQAEVLFIKGDKHYSRWQDNADCDHCVEHRVKVPHYALCETLRGVGASYVIDHADTYYIIVTRQHRSEDDEALRANVNMKVIKTIYDTSNVKEICHRMKTCQLNLTYNADDDVIVEFPFPDYSYPGSVTYFTTDCHLRRRFWIGVFGLVPAGIILLLGSLCCIGGLCASRKEKKRQQKKDTAKLVFTVRTEEKKPYVSNPRDTNPPV